MQRWWMPSVRGRGALEFFFASRMHVCMAWMDKKNRTLASAEDRSRTQHYRTSPTHINVSPGSPPFSPFSSLMYRTVYLRVGSIKPRKKSKRMASSRVHVLLASWLLLLVIAPVFVKGENCDQCYTECKEAGSWEIFCFRCHVCKFVDEWKRPMPDNDTAPIFEARDTGNLFSLVSI